MTNEFGEAILRYRARNNLSQKELAELCKLSRPTLTAAENGKSVSKFTKDRIEEVMKNDV